MPSYLGTDISESKKWSKANHNTLFPHLGQARRFPLGQIYQQKHWIRHWRCQSCCERRQTCWEPQFHWKAHSCVHRALTSEKYWARRKSKTERSPGNSLISCWHLFFYSQVFAQEGGHVQDTHIVVCFFECAWGRGTKPPALLSWNKYQDKREIPYTIAKPLVPAKGKGGFQRWTKARALPNWEYHSAWHCSW